MTSKFKYFKFPSDVRDARIELLKVLQLTTTTPEQIEEVSTKYMSLIQGLFEVPSESQPKEADTTSDDQNNTSESKSMFLKVINFVLCFKHFYILRQIILITKIF